MKRVPILVVAIAATACATVRSIASPRDVTPGTVVTIRFTEPRDFYARSDSATHPLLVVRALRGRAVQVNADTLLLGGLSVLDSQAPQGRPPAEALLALVPGASDSITTQEGRSTAVSSATVGLGMLGILALLYLVQGI